MASPQWKSFQPPTSPHDPAILAFERSGLNNSPTAQSNKRNTMKGSFEDSKEKGYIEKLCHSYGFIQCCERKTRLFFHYSEYSGNMDTIKTGDYVECQISSDKRTGKPIAIGVDPLTTDSNKQLSTRQEILSETSFTGTVASEARRLSALSHSGDGLGTVAYEHSGEFFFVPYSTDDVTGDITLKSGDQVTFYLATDKRNGNIRARQIVPLEKTYQGVVCSMKDKFGFIERSDVVREIFFHYSEFKGNINELILGDDVEFSIQRRNDKEVAINISTLPEGTVIFEDISIEQLQGTVLKTLDGTRNRRQSDPLAGKISYKARNETKEIPFGDKDQKGDFTLMVNDSVWFNVATDRRDKLQRATNIELNAVTFDKNEELRECGVVCSLKEGFGFIKCADRDARMFFHFNEVLDARELRLTDELEFTIVEDPGDRSRQIATRIKCLPKGTIYAENMSSEVYTGVVEREPDSHKMSSSSKEPGAGIIHLDSNEEANILFTNRGLSDIRNIPMRGDKVEFNIIEVKRNKQKYAVNIKLISRGAESKHQGFIATLKESFGFIETAQHDKEIFFHYSSFDGEVNDLELGDEVEFLLTRKMSRTSAENIKKLSKGTVAPMDIQSEILSGKVVRSMKAVDPDQNDYQGLIEQITEDGKGTGVTFPYSVISLADKKDYVQKDDAVKFQVGKVKATGVLMAVCLAATRKYIRAKVDSLKGQFGFIDYEVDEGKKLFFHMTEVTDEARISVGDEVEFVVVHNQRNGKYSACSIQKISTHQRPERLISRLKSVSGDGRKVIVIRQPRGPNGTRGFEPRMSLET